MDEKAIGLSVLAIVGVIAVVSVILLYKDTTALASFQNYEQPANNKPVFIQTSVYMDNFNLCKQFTCPYYSPGVIYGESEPAVQLGVEELTGNLVCGCPDGKVFQIRPDRIEVATY